ncbi:cytochrome c oxidase assembly protein [uncultured Jatrophihabitans sp.]|uniref:cytochrome c oxidase assembly protein n=1 Tax=uncultured Jatrophihabitans sp. TaxID=1610747 RepID=UPI0035C9D9D3
MDLALDRPDVAGALTQWSVEPLAVVVVVVLAVSYAYGVRRLRRPWPRGRSATFAVGLLLFLWTTSGFPEVYAGSLFWAWTAQTLVLWLFVPIVVLFGHPLQLARAVGGPGSRLDRVLQSKPVRVVANPLIGPALVPALSFVLFFGPLPGWAIGSPPVGWLLHLALVLVGAVMVLPLVGFEDDISSLAVGLSLAIGSFELVIDALPGIVLRLNTHLSTSYFDHVDRHSWSPTPLHDQQLGGGILWTVAELIDLPFLFLVFRRWLRADARDAANIDAVLEAERASRRGFDTDTDADADAGARADTHDAGPWEDIDARTERDVPWWEGDPAMERRLRRLQ